MLSYATLLLEMCHKAGNFTILAAKWLEYDMPATAFFMPHFTEDGLFKEVTPIMVSAGVYWRARWSSQAISCYMVQQ